MPKLYNHSSHLNAIDYESHNTAKAEYMETQGGLYSARALPCTLPEDAIQLDPRLKYEYPYIREHLEEVGLDTAEEVVWDVSPEVSDDFEDFDLSVWLFNEGFNSFRPNPERLGATRRFNNKNFFIQHCVDMGYPAPKTLLVDGDSSLPDFTGLQLPVYLKAARSSDGASIYRLNNLRELQAQAAEVGDEYQVQEEVPGVSAFLNVQYRSIGGQALYLATTEQILEGFSHAGNRHPAEFDPRPITDAIANDISESGVEDIFALDVAVTPEGSHLIECNARWNGSTYPSVVAQRLGTYEWTAHTIPTTLSDFSEIKLRDLAYDSKRGDGVIILNAGHMAAHSKVGVMFIGPAEAQEEQKIKLAKILSSSAEDTPSELIAA